MSDPSESSEPKVTQPTTTRADVTRAASGPSNTRATKRKRRYFSQQGVALIAVSVATAIVGIFVTEFSTNTNVDMAAARNAEADMKTHFLARSGMNLSQLIISLQQVLDNYRQTIGDVQIADYTSLFMGAFGGSKEEVEGLAAMLGGFAADDLRGLGVPEGSFDVQLTTDDRKINVNCANRSIPEQKNLYAQLAGLFYFDAYNPVFENEDAEGWRRDRDTQVAALIDYVDQDRGKFSPEGTTGAPEDYGYESLRDKYEAKNSYLDTVDEIKLMRGVDDRFWALFGDAFTVYGDCKVNLSAVDNPLLVANIILLAAKDKNDPAANDPQNIWTLAQLVIKAREFGFSFAQMQDLANFVKSPQDAIEPLLQSGVDPAQLGIDQNLLAVIQQVKGVEMDTNQMNQIAKVGPRRTYRVEATATYGKVQKRIVGVWDTKVVPSNPNTRTPGNIESRGPGTWVYWRED
jgi:general secretion pathway protein K